MTERNQLPKKIKTKTHQKLMLIESTTVQVVAKAFTGRKGSEFRLRMWNDVKIK